jgi:hypothetical protein
LPQPGQPASPSPAIQRSLAPPCWDRVWAQAENRVLSRWKAGRKSDPQTSPPAYGGFAASSTTRWQIPIHRSTLSRRPPSKPMLGRLWRSAV